MKKLFPIIVIAIALILSGCGKKKPEDTTDASSDKGKKLVINQLEQTKRPFVLLSEHSSNKLLTFYMDNHEAIKEATVDIEYLSGELLKGARSTLTSPIDSPFTQAFLLGSCSAGGKCSFDKDLVSGSVKLRLTVEGESDTHVLKGDYVFVTEGDNTTSDARVTYTPQKLTGNQILTNTLGTPTTVEDSLVLYPLAITSTDPSSIQGKLTIKQANVASVKIYNGQKFTDLKANISDKEVSLTLNHTPWSQKTEIIRDDLKGAKESQTFYIVGPIILISK